MLTFMRQIRLAYPARRRLYWIRDNLSANWVPAIRAFAAANRIELVPTPTYASYLNPVECHFSALTEFVVANADYLDCTHSDTRSPSTSAGATATTATDASQPPRHATVSPPDRVTSPTKLQTPLAAPVPGPDARRPRRPTHMSLAPFTGPLADADATAATLADLGDVDLGVARFDRLELVRYERTEQTVKIVPLWAAQLDR